VKCQAGGDYDTCMVRAHFGCECETDTSLRVAGFVLWLSVFCASFLR